MPGIKGTMEEFAAGTLHSGSKTGPVVKSRKQAIAIGLSEERRKPRGYASGGRVTSAGERRAGITRIPVED